MLGQTALMGVLTGFLAIELGAQGAAGTKLWTLYEHETPRYPWPFNSEALKVQRLPYARLCADNPLGAQPLADLCYWINPRDELTQCAGLGSEWLIPLAGVSRNGLIPVSINTLMLDTSTLAALGQSWH